MQMEKEIFNSLSISLTEACNFRCAYCYQKSGGRKRTLPKTTLKRALDFFFPYLKKEAYVIFYGGEPLLEWDKIVFSVETLNRKAEREGKKLRYGITTNGSLLQDRHLEFFDRHAFEVTLSFDGLAQDIHRGTGTQELLIGVIKKILARPRIALTNNSVFRPATVGLLASSMALIAEMGIPTAIIAFTSNESWDEKAQACFAAELKKLASFLQRFYKRTGSIPVAQFRGGPSGRLFACFAGRNRIAIGPNGTIWGCFLFHDYFKGKKEDEDYGRFCFGSLATFMKNFPTKYEEIATNYGELRQDRFYTEERFCCECPELHECRTCPVVSGQGGSVLLHKVPLHLCRMQRIFAVAVKEFQRQISTPG